MGDITDEDLLSHMLRLQVLFSDGMLDSTWKEIATFDEQGSFEGITGLGVRRLAEGNPWPEGSLRAIVAPSDLVFGLGRMYQFLGEKKGDYVGLCKTEEEAMVWISQPLPLLQKADW